MSDLLDRLKTALADRYVIERVLGAGGMATVYLAEDLKLHRKVAIKVLRPELAAALGPERFLREIEIAAQLHHPHILPLHDSGEADGFLYYVMPFEEGPSLREKLAKEGKLPIAEAVRLLRDVVDALAHAHKQGVVHRDIKPDNVMLSDRHALVTDFGVAKAVTEATGRHQLTTAGVALGTPAYMAPEQAAADPHIDHRADIYAVGALAYELLTGGVPFTRSTAQAILSAHLTEAPEPVSKRRDNIPPALAQLVMKCLEKEPGRRFQTADEILSQIEGFVTPSGGVRSAVRAAVLPKIQAHRLGFSGGVVVIVALVVGVVFLTAKRRSEVQWVRNEALPEIARLAEVDEREAAYRLALRILAVLPNDSVLNRLLPSFSRMASINTEPSGAAVYRKPYSNAADEWEFLGTTPLEGILVPRQRSRVRFELAGYRALDVVPNSAELARGPPFVLEKEGSIPDEMVRVPSGEFTIQSPGFEHLDPVRLEDYLIGKHEVTNGEFRQFVEAGGYRSPQYWEHDVIRDGRQLAWEEAMELFRDKTGRPGPSTWEAGDYPAGEQYHPVAGVSWYEAAAYARFVGKQLPTIYQWNKAASTGAASLIAPLSNFDGRGPARVGLYEGMGRYGTLDMAGNVREWCVNATDDGRFILGGGWNDEAYTFVDGYSQQPLDRSPTNGFRIAEYLGDDESLTVASRPIDLPFRDFSTERPASDVEFAVFVRAYAYDATPLNASVEAERRTTEWTRQRITFDAAYGNERMMAYLWLPASGDGPFQTVVHFPGSGAIFRRSIDEFQARTYDFILKSGRAFMLPFYKGTYERGDDLDTDMPNESNAYKDHVAQWGKDLSRSIDYLQTREDIAADQLAYYGFSWGARMGGLMVAIEPRFETAIFYIAGLKFQRAQPEADPFNFVPRITMPVLMLNGRLDHYFPLETSQKPMFQLLGTPAEHKRHVVYDGGHFVPRPQLIAEVLDWLDGYLGPVR